MYSDEYKVNLLNALKKIRKYRLWYALINAEGTCSLLDEKRVGKSLFLDYCGRWPKSTGSRHLPVPPPEGCGWDRWDAYHKLNKWRGKYGALRLELIDFVIKELEDEI